MLTVTLDTSAALNFLGEDADASDDLAKLVGKAFTNAISIGVTGEAHAEVGTIADDQRREQRLTRLRSFTIVATPPAETAREEQFVVELRSALFPNCTPESKTGRHNTRDCRHLATHLLAKRDLFVTTDEKLWKKRAAAAKFGVAVMLPGEALARVNESTQLRLVATVDATNVRDAALPDDGPAIREILAPLAGDYPDFDNWLTRTLEKVGAGEASARVAVLEGEIGAVALSSPKGDRTIKLSAFFVAPEARDAGLGPHLLWDEVRRWVAAGYDKAFVTVSSRHDDLVPFLREVGFLIEGVSPRRYQDDTAEIVLGKHLVREVLTNADAQSKVEALGRVVLAPPAGATPPPGQWGMPPAEGPTKISSAFSANGRFHMASENAGPSRRWTAGELEMLFHPLRFALAGRKTLVVPIQPAWADEMIAYPKLQSALFDSARDKLLMRADNVYYAFPKCLPLLHAGTPILFYVNGGVGFVGEARLIAHAINLPEELFAQYGQRGVYELDHIRHHVQDKGENAGCALALHFGFYVPFTKNVPLNEAKSALGRNINPRGLTPLPVKDFETLRRTGGLEW